MKFDLLQKGWIIYPYSNGSGGGSGCVISNSDPVPETHGGLEAGSVIQGQNACQVLETILFPYQYPSFTSFYIQGQDVNLEVGESVSGGIRTFKWTTSNSQNIQENTIKIEDVTESVILGENLANDGTEDLDIGNGKVKVTPGMHSWKISALNTKGQTFSRNFNVRWYYRVYWGENENSTLTETEVKNLSNSALKDNYNGNYSFTANGNKYYYIVYPDSWGDINNWVDTDTGFGVDYEYAGTVDVTNSYGVNVTYRLLRTTYQQNTDLNSSVS